jgi:hypothetical protein
MMDVEIGDCFWLRCKPGCALIQNGLGEKETYSIDVNDRITACVRFIKGDLVAVSCSDDSYNEEGYTTRVLHKRALESCMIRHFKFPQPQKASD